MALKYLIDAFVIRYATGVTWTPLGYLAPMIWAREHELAETSAALDLMLVIWTLPFLWIGVALTTRRAFDAGISSWSVLLFFLPLVNYAWMLLLCTFPSTAVSTAAAPRVDSDELRVRTALVAAGVSVLVCSALVAICTLVLHSYGWTVLAGTPVVLGLLTGYLYNRKEYASLGHTLGVVFCTLFMAAGSLLLFAVEGVLCILMAAPIAAVLACLGAVLGRGLAWRRERAAPATFGLLALPFLAVAEARVLEPAHYRVTTAHEIQADPALVWKHVVSFSELPPPHWLPFRLGIAYPLRARIDGAGVGAIRHCEFSTGAFVEPITVWDEPERLAFDVVAQPAPMRELSPYGIEPPHLDHFIKSRRGEFLLQRTPAGGTRLVGSTWYELEIRPEAWFRLWADGFIHGIHERVLAHIGELAEQDAQASFPSASVPVGEPTPRSR